MKCITVWNSLKLCLCRQRLSDWWNSLFKDYLNFRIIINHWLLIIHRLPLQVFQCYQLLLCYWQMSISIGFSDLLRQLSTAKASCQFINFDCPLSENLFFKLSPYKSLVVLLSGYVIFDNIEVTLKWVHIVILNTMRLICSNLQPNLWLYLSLHN